jgi:hypothetical protein
MRAGPNLRAPSVYPFCNLAHSLYLTYSQSGKSPSLKSFRPLKCIYISWDASGSS